jgi:hypothetical protein
MPILDEIQQPTTKAMNIDMPAVAQEPQNQEAETLKEMQPEKIETAPKVNGMSSKMIATVEPNESQTTISEHPTGETSEYISAWSEWVMKEQIETIRTLSQPPLQ